ncbi:hypothetical protein [Bradyrhizobium elkanii]|uniref:Twin-arginine translocation signal domain-containing protein n=1 Tax=Bradyrhizobium elkanii TaxID=29448 RepID=A0A8I1YCZ6_BRAEL|nr:hypothetical protein [Bradyrhizobium elkanii]MBP1297482.1 hypothetical protein [Bradyrhizobium elkanii]
MSQAKTTNTTSRRRFLAGAAVTAVVPTTAVAAAQGADPIFALIKAHREAAKVSRKAAEEQCRREQILIDEGIGLCPFAVITFGGRPATMHSHAQIDNFKTISERQRAKAHADLDAALKRYGEIFGDAEKIADAAYKADCEALDRLLSTVPTSPVGLHALLSYLVEEIDDIEFQLRDECRVEMLMVTVRDALLAGRAA